MNSQNCKTCGSILPNGAGTCPSCGTVQIPAYPTQNAGPAAPPVYGATPPVYGAAPPVYGAAPSASTTPYAPAPAYGNNIYSTPESDAMSLWDFLWPLLLPLIPLAGSIAQFIVLLVFAFGSGGQNRKNYGRAVLLSGVISGLIVILVLAMAWGSLVALINGISSGYGGDYYAITTFLTSLVA